MLVKEMDTNGDGNVTLKEFASFINLDDHEPLYQPLFDGRRRNVNILQASCRHGNYIADLKRLLE